MNFSNNTVNSVIFGSGFTKSLDPDPIYQKKPGSGFSEYDRKPGS